MSCLKHIPIFNDIFYAFIIIGTDISGTENTVSAALKFVIKLFALPFGFFLDGFGMDLFSPIVYFYLGLLFSYILHRKRQDYAKMLQVLSKCNTERKHVYALNRKRRQYIIMLQVCMLYFVILFSILVCFSIIIQNIGAFSLKYSCWTSVLQNISSKLNNIYSVLLYFTASFCC